MEPTDQQESQQLEKELKSMMQILSDEIKINCFKFLYKKNEDLNPLDMQICFKRYTQAFDIMQSHFYDIEDNE